MPDDPNPTLSALAGEAILAGAFERLRPRLLAMIGRRVGSKLAARIDPEGVVQEAYLRARSRWPVREPRPADLDAWVYSQVLDRLRERIRGALGPMRDAGRDVPWPDDSLAPWPSTWSTRGPGPTRPSPGRSGAPSCGRPWSGSTRSTARSWRVRYFDGLSFAQIGAILGLKENTANARALRAAVKFRRLIPASYRPPGASLP